jgi:hypothetical protein
MAGSNAIAAKTALVALLAAALSPVRVDGAYNGRLTEREYLYFGHIAGTQEPMTFRAGGRMPRLEEFIVEAHLEVVHPNGTVSDTEARAVTLGQLIEEALAADPTQAPSAVTGLMAAWISNFTLTSFYPSDGVAATEVVYTITVQSRLG